MSRLEVRKYTKRFINQQEQRCIYLKEVTYLNDDRQVSRKSSTAALNPFLDEFGIMRVGCRLNKSLPLEETNPIISLRKGHIA